MAKKTKISPRLIKYLEKAGFSHEILEHRTVYSALDAALTMKRKINEIAKSLLIKADKDYYVVVLPADNNINLDKVAKIIKKETGKDPKSVKIPGEKIMETVFKIKAGAMSAFGGLYKLPVIVEDKITKVKKAVFSSDSHNHSIELSPKDFIEIEGAMMGNFGVVKKIKIQKKPIKKNKTAGKKKPTLKKLTTKKGTAKKTAKKKVIKK